MLHRNTVILSVLLFILNHRINGQLCHRERVFRQVTAGSLSVMSTPLATKTVASNFFCTEECLVTTGCKSYIFKTKESSNNCLLSGNPDGEELDDNTDVVTYRRHFNLAKPQSCEDNPCQNGGICHDRCFEPRYHCECDTAVTEGIHCEHSLVCVDADWSISFDSAGYSNCPDNYLLSGIYRAGGDWLDALDKGHCCPPQLAYLQEPMNCHMENWWETFAKGSWTSCPAGTFIAGFYRTDGTQEIGFLEEARCCKPVNGANHYGPCYTNDVSTSFDNWWQWAKCDQPQYYMVAIYSSACQDLPCIEAITCCQIAPLP